MKRWLDQVPAAFRLSDRTIFARSAHGGVTGETAEALRRLNALPGAFIRDFVWWPKRLLIGQLLARQGKPDLARREFEAARADLARERARAPNLNLGLAETWILFELGEKPEVMNRLKLWTEALARPFRAGLGQNVWLSGVRLLLLLEEREQALPLLREAAQDEWSRQILGGLLIVDPRLATWRNDPEIMALFGDR